MTTEELVRRLVELVRVESRHEQDATHGSAVGGGQLAKAQQTLGAALDAYVDERIRVALSRAQPSSP